MKIIMGAARTVCKTQIMVQFGDFFTDPKR